MRRHQADIFLRMIGYVLPASRLSRMIGQIAVRTREAGATCRIKETTIAPRNDRYPRRLRTSIPERMPWRSDLSDGGLCVDSGGSRRQP